MPILSAIGSAIGGISSVITNGANNRAIAKQNKASQDYADKNYRKQRQDNLSDWERENLYNSPQAQMKRFQEAGLNKNLVYGQGSAGNAGSVNTATQQSADFNPHTFDKIGSTPLDAINAIYDLEGKKVAVDNLKVDNTIKIQDAVLRRMQTSHELEKDIGLKFDNQMKRDLQDTYKEMNRENLRQLKSKINGSIWDNKLKQEDLKLSKFGLSRGGKSPWVNMIAKMLENR